MNISSLSGLSGLQQQNIQKSASKLSAAIAALVSGSKLAPTGSDVASLSVASQLQSSVSSLRQASASLAQISSLAQVAGSGVAQLQNVAEQLQSLAQQAASPVLNDDGRKALDEEFKQLVQQIDNVVSNTKFNDKELLNGDLSGAGALSLAGVFPMEGSDTGSLSIENLSAADLLEGNALDLSTQESASSAFAVIGAALGKINSASANTGSFLQAVDYAAASIDSAAFNQEAARSVLQDADFTEAASQQSQAALKQNAALAIAAQGNRLTPALLQLVS
jgi:flagellin